MGMTSERSLSEVQKLFDMCFDANALTDRVVYVLSIRYNMVKFADWLHHKVAHYFTGDSLADGIEAFGEKRGDLFYRGEIKTHKEDYDKPEDALKAVAVAIGIIESQCKIAIRVCSETNDLSYEDYLRTVNVGAITPLLKQITVLYNQIVAYADTHDTHKFNKDFEAWLLPEFGGDDDD